MQFIIVDVDLVQLGEIVFVRFLHYKVTHPHPHTFGYCPLERKLLCAAHT